MGHTSWARSFPPFTGTSHPSPIIHVSFGTGLGDLAFAGLIGGLTILVGVVTAEWGVRLREHRRDLNQATHELLESCQGHTLGFKSDLEVQEALSRLVVLVSRVNYYARRPLRRAKAIRQETRAIRKREIFAMAEWFAGGPAPNLRNIVGTELHHLVTGQSNKYESEINADLEKAGFPPIDDWTSWTGWTKVPLRIK